MCRQARFATPPDPPPADPAYHRWRVALAAAEAADAWADTLRLDFEAIPGTDEIPQWIGVEELEMALWAAIDAADDARDAALAAFAPLIPRVHSWWRTDAPP